MKRAWLVCLAGGLSLVNACSDDSTPSETAESSSTGEGEESDDTLTTTQSTLTTSADDTSSESSSAGTSVDSSSSEGDSSSTAADESSSSDSGDLCGNDMIDDGEACDGTDVGGSDCTLQGFDGGELGCNASCTQLDTTQCTMADCGDGVVNGRELCDGANLGGADCLSEGYGAGTLACSPNCAAFNFNGCSDCGDNDQDGDELCDGTDLAGEDCLSQGFQGGTLSCANDCTALDTTGCNNEAACAEQDIGSAVGQGVASDSNVGEDDELVQSCGNGALVSTLERVILWTAPADGTYRFDTVGSSMDSTIALYSDCNSPQLACNDDIGSGEVDSRLVQDVTEGQVLLIAVSAYSTNIGTWVLNIDLDGSSGSCCSDYGGAGCDSDAACETTVCALDADCCSATYNWNSACAALAVENCASCQGICGNLVVDADEEACDTSDFGSETCISQGFDYGSLDCADDCTIETTQCGNFGGDCCADNGPGSPGCDDEGCTAFVCADNPDCCDEFGTWDATCAGIAATACVVCNPDACGNNLVEGVEVCDGIDLADDDCSNYGFDAGALACADDCTAVDTSGCYDGFLCVEEDLGSALGDTITTGMNMGEDNEVVEGCGFNTNTDHVMSWTAPEDGTYLFTTNGSDFDTVLSLHPDCIAASLACDDDGGDGPQSLIQRDFAAGDVVLVNVTGYNTNVGTWELNINLVP